MNTRLEDKVTLWKVSAFAEMAMLEPRPELQRLCAAAEGGILTQERLESVLPGLSETARRNLLSYCKYLGLLDGVGRLTEEGRHCAASGEAPALEQGVYSFYLADHTASGVVVLHLKPERPDPYDRSVQDLGPVDHLLKDAFRLWESVTSPRQRFILRALPASKSQPPLGRFTELPWPCKICWDLDLLSGANRRWLEGKLELGEGESRQTVSFRKELPSLPEEKVRMLFGHWEARWSAERGYLAMAYDGKATPDGSDSFLRSFSISQVELATQGTFRNVLVKEVPVGPSDAQEAEAWALKLLVARVLASEGYLTEAALKTIGSEIVQGSPLELFSPSQPTPDRLLKELETLRTPQARHAGWRVAAPLDLNGLPQGRTHQ